MSTLPQPLSAADWKELGAMEEVREQWGAETPEEFEAMAPENIYAAKFTDFADSTPGYAGDLYILQGDFSEGDPPLTLIREKGKLTIFK
jgi:hypothetical protein